GDQVVDATQGGEHPEPVVQAVDRPARPLEAADALVGVDADDEHVAQRLGLAQVADVAAVEDVEAAVGEDHAAAHAAVRVEPAEQGGDVGGELDVAGQAL